MKKRLLIALFAVLFLTAMVSALVSDEDLIAYYDFEGNLNDLSGNSNDLDNKYVTFTTSTKAGLGKAGRFNGYNTLGSLNSDTFNMGSTENFSITAWANITALNQIQVILSKGIFNKEIQGTYNLAISQEGKLRLILQSSQGQGYNCILDGSSNLHGSGWKHLAVVVGRNSTCDSSTAVFYTDGVKETTNIVSQDVASNIDLDNNIPFRLGARVAVSSTSGTTVGGYLNGQLDELRIYKRILSASEINELYSKETQEPEPPQERQLCTDTDGGLNYFVKGKTTGYEQSPIDQDTLEDYCGLEEDSKEKLHEFYCGAGENIYSEVYNCPNGCSDGVCLNKSIPPAPVCPSGCITQSNECIPFGFRITQNNEQFYCDTKGVLTTQKSLSTYCQNNFECLSNQCLNGQCVDIQEKIEERVSFIGRFFCRLFHPFSETNYQECLAKFSGKEPICGNGIVEAGEECDDGNTISGDGCSQSCTKEVITPIATENITIKNSGSDKMTLTFISHDSGSPTTFTWASANIGGIKLTNQGNKIVVAENQPVNKSGYVVLGNEDNGGLFEIISITNSSSGFSDDSITLKNVMTGESITYKASSEGIITTTILGHSYLTKYYGASDSDTLSRQARFDFETDSIGKDKMIVYPSIQTSKGAKIMLYEPLFPDLNNWDGEGNVLNTVLIPDGDGFLEVSIPSLSPGTNIISPETSGLEFSITKYASRLDINLHYPVNRAGFNTTGIIIMEEKDDLSKYEAMVVTLEALGTPQDSRVGVYDVETTSTAKFVPVEGAGQGITRKIDYWGSRITIDSSYSQRIAEISYPDNQVFS